ncbi:MAG: YcaQ family DNA glycosylase [Spirochaetales bacterium]|nr:YcaQ family DNA glycosylase [Spirochaetales bacterium]
MTITTSRARRFLLAYQGLLPPYRYNSKAEILTYIKNVGCIQFDPLNIAGHNPELVLQARIKDFRPYMLSELLYRERKLLDGWDKNMSIYSAEDWPFFQRNRDQARQRYGHEDMPAMKVLPLVRKALEERGPLSSIDLDLNQVVGWSWSPTRIARAALESMYAWGELIIHHKVHTRKVYDFTCNHLPEKILTSPDPNEKTNDFHDWYVTRRIGSVGLLWNKSGGAWLGISGMNSKQRQEALARLCAQKKVYEIRIKGIDTPFYIRSSEIPLLERITCSEKTEPSAAVIAPLDNLLWDRDMVKKLFDFEYRWEVYKPIAERQYGYYVLPVLYKDRFIARFEPARDKKTGTLIIKGWWWENDVKQTNTMYAVLKACTKRFMHYLEVDTLKIQFKNPGQADCNWLV